MLKNLSVLAVLVAVSAGSAEAQSFLSDRARAELAQQSTASRRPPVVVFGAMGALIGAGTGFLLSHVAHSDWEKETNSTFASHRRSYALSGAAVGTVAAVLLDRLAPRGNRVLVGDAPDNSGAGGAITLAELAEIPAANALDAVRSLRPQWLQERGETLGSMGTLVGDTQGAGAGQVTTIPGEQRIGAFLDGVRLADFTALRDIPLNTVRRIEFRTGSVSASGPGHVQRAILVFSADGRTQ